MKFFRSLSLSALLVLTAGAVAVAQPQSSVLVQPNQMRTFRATSTAIVPAASATDLFTIQGASGKTISVRAVHCDGTADGPQNVLLSLIKRSTLDTGGSSTTATNIPLNPASVAASAVVKAYTANPTLGTAVATVQEAQMSTAQASPVFNNIGATFDFTNQQVFLSTSTSQLAVNANATSFNNNSKVNCWVEWSEQG